MSKQAVGKRSQYPYKYTHRGANLLITLLFVTLNMLSTQISITSAQSPATKTTGNLDLDLQTEKQDPYISSQEEALSYLQGLKSNLQSITKIEKKVILPSADVINYLSGLYLFCTIKRGTCPAVLEALFEVDLVNSKLSNTALCPVLRGFWKKYIANDFEDRLKYNTGTGFLSKVSEFNAKERPRFLRCEDSLKEVFSKNPNTHALFSKRFSEPSPSLKSIDEVIALIAAVQENQINVFIATGAQ